MHILCILFRYDCIFFAYLSIFLRDPFQPVCRLFLYHFSKLYNSRFVYKLHCSQAHADSPGYGDPGRRPGRPAARAGPPPGTPRSRSRPLCLCRHSNSLAPVAGQKVAKLAQYTTICNIRNTFQTCTLCIYMYYMHNIHNVQNSNCTQYTDIDNGALATLTRRPRASKS